MGTPSVSGSQRALTDPKANVLRAKVPTLESGEVPIITVDTQASDAAVAARLADESITVLKAHLATVAGSDKVPDARRLVVTELGPARSTVESRGPERMMAIAAALFVFTLGCAAIVGISALISGWRTAAALEDIPEQEQHDFDAFVTNQETFEDGSGDKRAGGAASALELDEAAERHPARQPNTVGS